MCYNIHVIENRIILNRHIINISFINGRKESNGYFNQRLHQKLLQQMVQIQGMVFLQLSNLINMTKLLIIQDF